MVRLQIRLTDQQHRELKRWARRRGISLAEAVRRCVAGTMALPRAQAGRVAFTKRALSVIGRYAGQPGAGNVAQEHDAHLTRE